MAGVRNKNGESRFVPGYGVVEPDAVLEVPDGALYGFTCQEGWNPVGKAGQALHDEAEKASQAFWPGEQGPELVTLPEGVEIRVGTTGGVGGLLGKPDPTDG